jgi:glycosyltransferase involved in cell wall biosynthesis
MGLDEVANMSLPVSVIIPTHNSEKTVIRALESVRCQTESPAEVIVVDDCSTDSTVSIVRIFADQHKENIQIIQLDANLGPSATRNTGWNEATAEFVAFLDSDDSWHPDKLKIQATWMLNNPDHPITGHLTGSLEVAKSEIELPFRTFSLSDFLIRNRISTPTVMVRRSIPERFNSEMWYAEDYDLWLQILARCKTITRLEMALTQLHKADYGQAGLSSHLYPMFRGEISAVRRLRDSKHISPMTALSAQVWMTLKYVRRKVMTKVRRFA